MASQSDDKSGKSPYEKGNGRVVEDEMGRQSWQGTIRSVKLSLMKTGIFFRSEAQQRLPDPRESGKDEAGNDHDEDQDIADEGGGFDPYNSSS